MSEHRRSVSGLQRVSTDSPAAPVTRVVTGDLSGLRAKNRAAAPPKITTEQPATNPAPVAPAAEPAQPAPVEKKTNKAITVYISPTTYTQARLAYRATSSAEGDRNWSAFVEKAIAGEIERRVQQYNGGDPFEGVDTPLSPGRPLAD